MGGALYGGRVADADDPGVRPHGVARVVHVRRPGRRGGSCPGRGGNCKGYSFLTATPPPTTTQRADFGSREGLVDIDRSLSHFASVAPDRTLAAARDPARSEGRRALSIANNGAA